MGGGQSFVTQIPDGNNHQTRLLYCETWRVDSANRLFGACYNGNTVIIINPGRNPIKPYIRVPEGMYALVQSQGRDLDHESEGVKSAVWPAGFHWADPFTKVSHLVTKQFVVFETPVKGCKTADDVTVRIDMCLIFRIMGDVTKGEDPGLVRRFVYELGPNGLEVQLRAAQDEAVRGLARSVMHTEVYQLRDGTMKEEFSTGGLAMVNRGANNTAIEPLPGHEKGNPTLDENGTPLLSATDRKPLYYVTEDIKKNLNKQFNNYGVQITSVAITNVKLPANFQEQMQSRTTHLSAIKEQNMKQMSDMQLLQYKEEIDTTKLARKMMLMEEEQTGKAKCAEIQKEIDMVEADTKLVEEQIAQETKIQCNKIAADAALQIEQIKAETARISAEITSRCEAEVQLLQAEYEASKRQLEAEIEEIVASGDSKAMEIIARAEGAASKKLEKARAHQLEMQRLNLLTSLSKNKQAVVTGNASNSLLAEMLVANKQGSVLLNVGDGAIKGFMKSA
jgi:regulator of protease activity HflC (stomatin/prohibitin superfamily)